MSKLLNVTKGSFLHIRHKTTVTNIDVTASPSKPFSVVPGPTALPGIGQLYHFLPGGSLYKLRGYDLQNYLYETYGPVVKLKGNFGAPDSILLFDPEASLQILRAENSMPTRQGFFAVQYYKTVVKKEKGEIRKYNGLILDNDEKWREIRAAVNSVMMQAKSLMAYAGPLDEIAGEAVDRMKSIRDKNKMIKDNLLQEFLLYILDFTGQIALGERFHAFSPNARNDSVPQQLLQNIQKFSVLSDKLDFQPNPWRLYKNKTFRTAMNFFADAEKLNEKLLRGAVEKLKTNPKPDEQKGVLQKLAEVNEDVALAFADDIFLVGIDTVATATISLLYLLAINPDKQSKLREEMTSTANRLPYMKACIKEAARMRPVSFGNLRQTTTDYNVFDYNIPKGTLVLFCHEHMSLRDEQYPLARQYIPERWLVDRHDPLYHGNAHPLASPHFGYGARGCVGQKVADMEMETLLKRIIQNFNIEWRGEPMQVYQSITNHNMAPYNFVFNDL